MAEKTAPLGICDLCGGEISPGPYTSKDTPRLFCSRECRNTANSRAGAAIRYATQEKVKGGVREWRQWWKDNKAKFDVDHAANLRAEERMKQEQKKAQRAERKKRKKKKDGGSEE